VHLDLDAVIDAARRRHGGDDLHPVDLEGFRILASEARAATGQGRAYAITAADWIPLAIETRFRMEAAAPATAPLARPVFIISGGRTGSTLLHRLLALDPGLRAPKLWELRHPFAADAEARRAAIASAEALLRLAPPAALALHPMAAEAPEECHWLLRHNPSRAAFQVAPAYWEWLRTLQRAQLLRLLGDYRRVVATLQQRDAPGRRWLSKAFAHSHFWPVLFEVFPDAKVIRLHRDPREAVASACSVVLSLARGADPAAVREIVVGSALDGLRRAEAAVAEAPPGAVIDLLYDDLTAAPAQTLARLGAWLGLADPEALAAQVRRYLAGSRRLRAAPHGYSLGDFGLDADEVLDLFEGYIVWCRDRLGARFAS
jgi:hypothetical protein